MLIIIKCVIKLQKLSSRKYGFPSGELRYSLGKDEVHSLQPHFENKQFLQVCSPVSSSFLARKPHPSSSKNDQLTSLLASNQWKQKLPSRRAMSCCVQSSPSRHGRSSHLGACRRISAQRPHQPDQSVY